MKLDAEKLELMHRQNHIPELQCFMKLLNSSVLPLKRSAGTRQFNWCFPRYIVTRNTCTQRPLARLPPNLYNNSYITS